MDYGLLHPLDGLLVLDLLELVSLLLTAGYELEGSFAAEVPEILARFPPDIHGLDVVGGEVIAGGSAFGLESYLEGTKVSKLDALALEQEVAETVDGDGEHTDDVALVIDAAMTVDVLCEGVDIEYFAVLCHAVGLGFLNVLLLGAGLGAHDCDTVVNHSFLFFGGS